MYKTIIGHALKVKETTGVLSNSHRTADDRNTVELKKNPAVSHLPPATVQQ